MVKREQRGHEASSSERFAVVINRYEVYDYIRRCMCNLIFCYRKSEPVQMKVSLGNYSLVNVMKMLMSWRTERQILEGNRECSSFT